MTLRDLRRGAVDLVLVYAGGAAGAIACGLLGGQVWDWRHPDQAGTLAALDGLLWVGYGVLIGTTIGIAAALAVFRRGWVLTTAGLTFAALALSAAMPSSWIFFQVAFFFVPGVVRIAVVGARNRSGQRASPLAAQLREGRT